MKTLTLNAWGSDHEVSFRIDNYVDNNNLYVGIICYDDGYPELWSDLTVNLGEKCADFCAFIDTNNNGVEILRWIIENRLGYPTGRISTSGFCAYPEVCFNLAELSKYTSIDKIINKLKSKENNSND